MNLSLLTKPRLLTTKLLQRYCRSKETISPGLHLLLRDRLRKLAIDKELRTRTKGGFSMFVSPRNYASYSIFFFGVYDPEMTSVFSHLIRPGQTVWDVGTERGWFSLLMGKLVGQNGRVDSFEAFPPNFKNFKAN